MKKFCFLVAFVLLSKASFSQTNLITLSEGNAYLGYLGRGLSTTGAWNQTPDILALTYQGRDFAIGGWSKSNFSWMGAAFYINSDSGNIGIGTVTPNVKLAVNGNIRAKEIKVETANWPDYVFAKDYSLPSLAETEKHIKEKGHLSGIPSAKDVKENGINLGEMNAKLLKKIEELTLYLIQKTHNDEKLQQELEEQRNLIREMEGRLKDLEK